MLIRSRLGSVLIIGFAAVGVIATMAIVGMAGMHLGMGGMMGEGMSGMLETCRNMMGA